MHFMEKGNLGKVVNVYMYGIILYEVYILVYICVVMYAYFLSWHN